MSFVSENQAMKSKQTNPTYILRIKRFAAGQTQTCNSWVQASASGW